MSNFKNGAPNNQLAQARPQDGIQRLLQNNWDRIAAVMPRHLTSERLFQLSVSAINQTPKLAQCDPASLLSCVMKCSALGLEPSAVDGLGRAFIVPYGSKATFILGYRGLIDLARRSGNLKSIHAQAVYQGDDFDMWEDEEGQHFKFRPARDVPHTKDFLTDVYVAAHLMDGGLVLERMTKNEVEAIRNRSPSKNSGPWKTDYEAMALKTVIRRAAKYLPLATQAQSAIASDETTPDYSSVFSPVVPTQPMLQSVEYENVPETSQNHEYGPETAQVDNYTGDVQYDANTGELFAQGDIADYDIPFPGEG